MSDLKEKIIDLYKQRDTLKINNTLVIGKSSDMNKIAKGITNYLTNELKLKNSFYQLKHPIVLKYYK